MLVGDGLANVCAFVWLPKIVTNPTELVLKCSNKAVEHEREMCKKGPLLPLQKVLPHTDA